MVMVMMTVIVFMGMAMGVSMTPAAQGCPQDPNASLFTSASASSTHNP